MQINLNDFKIFEKQIILKKIGISGQKKIKNSNVLIIGMGGLGNPLLSYLAAAGVGFSSYWDLLSPAVVVFSSSASLLVSSSTLPPSLLPSLGGPNQVHHEKPQKAT